MGFLKNLWSKFAGLKVWQKVLVIFVLFAVASAAGGSSSSTSSSDSSSSKASTKVEKAATPKGPAIGSTAADGKFAFAIWKMNCSKTSVGSDFSKSTAQGHYCILDIAVKNIGKEAQTIFSSNMKLIDSEGREFKTDDMAMMNAGQTDLWLKEINPGNQVNGQLIFDVPTDAKIVTAELHDSAFSGGVKVDLTRKDPAYKG